MLDRFRRSRHAQTRGTARHGQAISPSPIRHTHNCSATDIWDYDFDIGRAQQRITVAPKDKHVGRNTSQNATENKTARHHSHSTTHALQDENSIIPPRPGDIGKAVQQPTRKPTFRNITNVVSSPIARPQSPAPAPRTTVVVSAPPPRIPPLPNVRILQMDKMDAVPSAFEAAREVPDTVGASTPDGGYMRQRQQSVQMQLAQSQLEKIPDLEDDVLSAGDMYSSAGGSNGGSSILQPQPTADPLSEIYVQVPVPPTLAIASADNAQSEHDVGGETGAESRKRQDEQPATPPGKRLKEAAAVRQPAAQVEDAPWELETHLSATAPDFAIAPKAYRISSMFARLRLPRHRPTRPRLSRNSPLPATTEEDEIAP